MASESTDGDVPHFAQPVEWPVLECNVSVERAILSYDASVTRTDFHDERFKRARTQKAVDTTLMEGFCGRHVERCITAALAVWVKDWDSSNDDITASKRELSSWLSHAVDLVAKNGCEATIVALNKACGVSKSAELVVDALQTENTNLQRELGMVQDENVRMEDAHRRELADAKAGAVSTQTVGRKDQEIAFLKRENVDIIASLRVDRAGVAAERERVMKLEQEVDKRLRAMKAECDVQVEKAELALALNESKLVAYAKEISVLTKAVRVLDALNSASPSASASASSGSSGSSAERTETLPERRVILKEIVGDEPSMYFELASPDVNAGKFARVSKDLARKVRYDFLLLLHCACKYDKL
jgi:hypothetical protein